MSSGSGGAKSKTKKRSGRSGDARDMSRG